MPRDLIVFGEDWGGLPSSTQHLIRHLGSDRKVLWVNSIGLRRPRLQPRDLQRAWHKLLHSQRNGPAPTGEPEQARFRVLNPRTLPVPRTRLARRIASGMLARQIRPLAQQMGLQSPVLWTSLPTAVDVAGQLGESALLYYCGDDFGALAGVDHATVSRREVELAGKADLILAASDRLAERFPAARTRLLPHGVDHALFATPCPRAPDLPDDGRPVAGFYGSISEWIDIELLVACAQRLPHWHFVFIGTPVIDIQPLQRLHNVRLLGPRAHAQLPGYVQHWNVSLLPFRDNAQIQACNPLKLREYLAAGRPIVSTPFPALQPYQAHVSTVSNAGEMVAALQAAADMPCSPDQQASVAEHTWQARAAQLATWVERL